MYKPAVGSAKGYPSQAVPGMPVAVIPSQFEPEETETPAEREQRTVHDVYESIAPHFSATRYKPWPIISRFLANVPPNSIGLDSGAGNGKYLPVLRSSSPGSMMLALDRSSGLLEIARTQKGGTGEPSGSTSTGTPKGKGKEDGLAGDMKAVRLEDEQSVLEECLRADLCFNGWRDQVFDFAISIAAVHHLSTPARRMDSVRSLIRPLRLISPSTVTRSKGDQGSPPRCARFLIYVWAFEQGENSKRKMGVLASKTSAAQEDENAEKQERHNADDTAGGMTEKDMIAQDVMVPWVLQPKVQPKPKTIKKQEKKARGSRGRGVVEAASLTDATETQEQTSVDPPQVTSESDKADEPKPAAPQVFHRYYHLFVKGELRDLVLNAGRAEGFAIVEQPSTVSNVPQDSSSTVNSMATGAVSDRSDSKKWLRIVDEGYEKDNWWLEGEVGLYPL